LAGPRQRLVLLDRDGVINRDSDQYIRCVEEWVPLPGSLEAIADLTAAGFTVVVVTNQSGIGRSLFDVAALGRIHAAMRRAVERAGGKIAAIYHCPHRPDDGCDCRKPRPGLLLQAARDFSVSLQGVPFIGDKASDVDAARAAGAEPVLVGGAVYPDPSVRVRRFADLAEASRQLIREAGDAA
jgi:D-glycero-D-manno-heptose 1,7-bisphosphate phosphatase